MHDEPQAGPQEPLSNLSKVKHLRYSEFLIETRRARCGIMARCNILVIMRSLGANRISKKVSHAKQQRGFERPLWNVFATSFQSPIQSLVEPVRIHGRIPMRPHEKQHVVAYVVLRRKAIVRHHQCHMGVITPETFLGSHSMQNGLLSMVPCMSSKLLA
jgi:hypothetical protein